MKQLDGTVRTWDQETGVCLLIVRTHPLGLSPSTPAMTYLDLLRQVKVTLRDGDGDGETCDAEKLRFFHDGRWFAMDK